MSSKFSCACCKGNEVENISLPILTIKNNDMMDIHDNHPGNPFIKRYSGDADDKMHFCCTNKALGEYMNLEAQSC